MQFRLVPCRCQWRVLCACVSVRRWRGRTMIVGGAAAALLLVLAPLTTEAANVTNSVVFAGNQNAQGSACQSWW